MSGCISNNYTYTTYPACQISNTRDICQASNSYNYPGQEYYSSGSQYIKNYYPHINQTQQLNSPVETPLITDPTIKEVVNKLKEVQYLPGDIDYIKSLGVNILYNNGEEAIKTLMERGSKIEFGKVKDPKIHAQFDNDKNIVTINDKYKKTKDPAVILAISEALFHELGHAKDKDGISSIQEEIDCLALNTLAYRCHYRKYSQVFNSAQNADIINNGVALYERLFFDKDPSKQGLVKRIIDRYGDLPMESPNHKAPISTGILAKIGNVK
jgi:hypothetical protein